MWCYFFNRISYSLCLKKVYNICGVRSNLSSPINLLHMTSTSMQQLLISALAPNLLCLIYFIIRGPNSSIHIFKTYFVCHIYTWCILYIQCTHLRYVCKYHNKNNILIHCSHGIWYNCLSTISLIFVVDLESIDSPLCQNGYRSRSYT